jgi:hypothetical protein
MKPKSDRMGYGFIAKSKAGRPPKQQLRVLVSFTTAAYVNATEESYRREWQSDGGLPFHQILNIIFDTLVIKTSVDEAIRRQKKSKP